MANLPMYITNQPYFSYEGEVVPMAINIEIHITLFIQVIVTIYLVALLCRKK
ncbi:hypothetical protein [Staphylococcus simiae]|uniref:hypothetical protein n=1 Tax=Staphylococcus simiae TaxID=308354 RepID=UPI001A96EC34|nr:hypothetical protein [Staphylococcus simiae]QSY54015.1 hypothetical protein J3R86_00615 [Staphylococcus simiae]